VQPTVLAYVTEEGALGGGIAVTNFGIERFGDSVVLACRESLG